MNRHDDSDDGLRAAFRARLDAAPEPPSTVYARTLLALREQPAPPARGVLFAARWWSALAGPARFALATAIVVVGGTIAFGTVKAGHERDFAENRAPAGRITLDQRSDRVPQLAMSGSLTLVVRDRAIAAQRIGAIVVREHGSFIPPFGSQAAIDAHRAKRILFRVPANRFDIAMMALAGLGRVESRHVTSADLESRLADADRRLQAARTTRELPDDAAQIERLTAARAALEARIATAVIAIVLRDGPPEQAASANGPTGGDEPAATNARPTSISLARGSSFETTRSDHTRASIRPIDRAASRDLTGPSPTLRTAARGDHQTDRA